MDKILVLGNYTDAMYHPLEGVDERLQSIFPTKELICTSDTTRLLTLKEENIVAIISYLDIWESTLTDRETNALHHFVEQGGALLLLHNGISIQNQDKLRIMMGAKFLTHPPMEDITFTPVSHAITQDCCAFTLPEEPYQFEFVDDNKEIILEYSYHDKCYIAGWSKQVNKGRLVFLTPGHTADIFDCKDYITLIQKSMEWCLRRI